MKKCSEPHKWLLTFIYSLIIFLTFLITMFIVTIIVYFIDKIVSLRQPTIFPLLIVIGITSIILGTLVGNLISHDIVHNMNALIQGMNDLSKGKYHTRLDLGHSKLSRSIENSFNTLAMELDHTEFLRDDFVNNFSHEIKTPVVSINGFAKLLQKENLSDDKRREYLKIIVDESKRLSDMSTKILELTHLENQNILINVEKFNLSEQLRECMLLLQKKWMEKELRIVTDFKEYDIEANKEMLKEVWINLFDNAIKFSNENQELKISIILNDDFYDISVINHGEMISEEDQKRIFQKFYQVDRSHAKAGNGIGLSIVYRIVELHDGNIFVSSNEDETIFKVRLPINRGCNEKETVLNKKDRTI